MSARPLGGRDIVAAALAVSLLVAFVAAHSPLLALLALLAIVFVSWIVSRAELVMIVMIAALPWEATLQFPSATLSLVKLLGLSLAAAYAFRVMARDEEIRSSPMIVCALLFGLAVGVSLIVSPEPSAGLVKAFRYAFFIGFLFLVTQLVDSGATARRLLRAYCLSASAAAVVGLLAFLGGAVSRASGPIEDPNDFAYLLATVIPVAVLLYVEDRHLRPLWLLSLAALLAGMLATLSRGAIVGIGALTLWAILSGRIGAGRLLLAGAGAAVLIATALAFWSPIINEHLEQKSHIGNQNVESRAAFWSAATEMSIENPAFGVGPARFGIEAPKYVKDNPVALQDPVVHNTYIEILAEDGPLALAAFVAMLATAWISVSRGESAGRAGGDLDAVRFAAMVKGMLIVAVVSAIFLSEQVAVPIWLACALAGSGAIPRSQPHAGLRPIR